MKHTTKIWIIILTIIVLGVVIRLIWGFWDIGKGSGSNESVNPSANKFGFLVGDVGEFDEVLATGAEWARPHPGPFIWGETQKDFQSGYNFDETDKMVTRAGRKGVSLLATLWPYAKWDQENNSNKENCQVDDEFGGQLGIYRCNPQNWSAYEGWVRSVVERYDGDGIDDMPKLKIRVKYWEVNNEPDLAPPPGEEKGLRFYIGGPDGYKELLRRTYTAIKDADPESMVLIAGAAGGDAIFLDFYRQLFADEEVQNYFDIGNVHCISNGDYQSFNFDPYSRMLTDEFGITKPIWITEAETFISDNPDIIATQLNISTQNSFLLGAQRIFYTALKFDQPPGGSKPAPKNEVNMEINQNFSGKKPFEVYQTIFNESE